MRTRKDPAYKLSLLRLLPWMLLSVGCMVKCATADSLASSGADTAYNFSVDMARDPFWPVGYTPEWIKSAGKASDETEDNGSSDWNAAMKQVVIQGVSSRSGNEFFAVINGQVRSVGEIVSVKYGNATYSWEIESISQASSVKLRRISAK